MATRGANNDHENNNASQQHKRISGEWFRSPVTEYLTVGTINYPKGSRATVADLDENNPIVDVLYFRNATRLFTRNGRQPEDFIIQLFVDAEEFQDATPDSNRFSSLAIQSKSLIDAIRPALASVNYPLPDNVNDQYGFDWPFHELFFAQGRLLETLKHAGLGNVKEKQLRTFVTVMQVVLRKLNHTVRDLAGKKVIDFENLWTLYPAGSFAVTTSYDLPHIVQVIENQADVITATPNARRKEERFLPIKFSCFGFDGVNFGNFENRCEYNEFKGHVSISSIEYRPLRFEERFEDNGLVKKAIERGRKSLDYQSFHHCQYTGKCYAIKANTEPPEQNLNGRVVVDAMQARKSGLPHLGYFCHTEHAVMPVPAKRQEIYASMRSMFLSTITRRPTTEEQEKRKAFFQAHEEYLMLAKAVLPVYSLEHNDWFWADVSKLEPVQFVENPMDRIIGSTSRQFGLLNLLVNQKLNVMAQELSADKQMLSRKQGSPFVACFSGPIGTGKTVTAKAIAELHQRPLILLGSPPAGTSTEEVRVHFAQILESAVSWRAIVLFDDAHVLLGLSKREIYFDQTHLGIDLANNIDKFRGIIFLTKRDDRRIVYDILKRTQAHVNFPPFDQEKREKMWRKLFRAEGTSLKIASETIKDISEWDLTGHDMKHLYDNIELMYSTGEDQTLTTRMIEELKDLTLIPKEEWKPSRPGLTANEPVKEASIVV